jgi:hypothetical protein
MFNHFSFCNALYSAIKRFFAPTADILYVIESAVNGARLSLVESYREDAEEMADVIVARTDEWRVCM